MKIWWFSLLTVLLLLACSESQPEERRCLSGTPEAIFSENDPLVTHHEFTRRGQVSTEEVGFPDGFRIAILQRGCDTLVQTFEITTTKEINNWPTFKEIMVPRFRQISVDMPHLPHFDYFAQGMSVVPDDYPASRPAPLVPGLSLRYFFISGPESHTWQVSFEQDMATVLENR